MEVNQNLNPHSLTLTFSLKEEDEDRMQLFYASQLYHTFFGVFGSFKLNRQNPNKLKLTGVYMRLINYKGLINLDISGVSNPLKDGSDLIINFKVKALKSPPVLRTYTFEESVDISNVNKIIFKRYVDRLSMDNETGVLNGAHDMEFYERDGLYNRKRYFRLDEEPDDGSDWGYNSRTGRRYKPKAVEAVAFIVRDEIKYIEGQEVDIDPIQKHKTTGGRCPKSEGIVIF